MNTKALIVIGLAAIGLGLLLGFSPGTAEGYGTTPMNCGSPWVRDDLDQRRNASTDELGDIMSGTRPKASDYRQRCDDALSTRGVFAWLALGAGVLVLVGAAVTHKPRAVESEPVADA